MSIFKFRLQKILDHRETIENINKGNYGNAKKMLEQEIEELESIKNMKKLISKEKEDIVGKKTTIESLKVYSSYLTDIGEKIKIQKIKIKEVEHVVEKTREVLIESTKEKKIMEKLKTRDYHEYIYEQKKEEEKANDQFVSYSSSTNITGD